MSRQAPNQNPAKAPNLLGAQIAPLNLYAYKEAKNWYYGIIKLMEPDTDTPFEDVYKDFLNQWESLFDGWLAYQDICIGRYILILN